MKHLVGIMCLLMGTQVGVAQEEQAEDAQLAESARKVMRQYCARCHQGEGSTGGDFDILEKEGYLAESSDGQKLIVPGKLRESYLWERIADGEMPPASQPQPTPAEKLILKKWIEAGSPDFPSAAPRPYMELTTVLTEIRDHLRNADREDRPFLRYFTLHNLANNPRTLDQELGQHRAALSKTINSLSWKARIVLPKAIDQETQLIYVLDIRDVDWDKNNLWHEIIVLYPYGLRYGNHPVRELEKLDEDIVDLTGCQIPLIRADWFITEATRPPLYHTLLNIPENARELERRLGVNIAQNFLHPKPERIARAGFAKSGVSSQNRMLERSEALYGAYWKSYDFKPDSARSKLTRFPLGPASLFPKELRGKEDFSEEAFIHDGGEIIFHLPNGLQGYMLTDGQDHRIDEGPIDVVSDSLKTSGTPVIVNGVSCMACHKHGMIRFKDRIRNGSTLFGKAEQKVKDLYPPEARMNELVDADQERFLAALQKATGSFLQVGDNSKKPLREFPEPIGVIARRHRLEFLDLATIATELDVKDPQQILLKVGEKKLKLLGLEALLKGGVVSRLEWETINGTSLMQELGRELRYTPVRVR